MFRMKTAAYLVAAGFSVAAAGASASIAPAVGAAGEARVRVEASVKTHSRCYHILEKSARGTDRYTIEVDVGGRTHRFDAAPQREVAARKPGRTDPEEGEGVRYHFSGEFSVPAGTHRVTVRLPDEDASVSAEVALGNGDNKILVRPVYGKLPRNRILNFRGERHFSQHIDGLELAATAAY